MPYELDPLIAFYKTNYPSLYKEAAQLLNQHLLIKLNTAAEENCHLSGSIENNRVVLAKVSLSFNPNDKKIAPSVKCSCSMPSPCLHGIALLIATQKKEEMDIKKASSWLDELTELIQKEQMQTNALDKSYEFHFVIKPDEKNERLYAIPQLHRRLKSGKLGASKRFNLNDTSSVAAYLLPGEQELLEKLAFLDEIYYSGYYYYAPGIPLKGKTGDEVLLELINTGKCYFDTLDEENTLLPGAPRPLSMEWKPGPNQSQAAHINIPGKKTKLLLAHSPWYYEPSTRQMGPLETSYSVGVIQHILNAPHIPEAASSKAIQLGFKNPVLSQLLNLNHNTPKDAIQLKPTPQLHLLMQTIETETWSKGRFYKENKQHPMASLSFQYKDQLVGWKNESLVVHAQENNQPIKIARDLAFEQACSQLLLNASLTPIQETAHRNLINTKEDAIHYFTFLKQDPYEFYAQHISPLQEKGWDIITDEDYTYTVIHVDSDDNEWFADIEPDDTSDWFDLSLGIIVGEEKVNLLPVINQLLSSISNKKDIQQIKEKNIFVPTVSGPPLALPGERIYQIVNSLIELYDKQSLTSDDLLRLSKNQAARLMEIQKATGAAQLRWFGGDSLRELGKRISEFTTMTSVAPPKNFQGTLRHYQQDGLDWLQFLREYELNGILADDMGLGKTVQTLAHILLEHESGRMTKPTLVIAPTSLMYNWQKETALFAPDLKVCVLQGPNRHLYFEHLEDYHLILTTYPLLTRDKDVLLRHSFHLLILDEAHRIKNSKAFATQIVMQLHAKHRLCLTGTPMENHLGELWSLFHFLMPGFLGNDTFFKRTFRTPIEKHADHERRLTLNRRIAPFLLRRTKDLVIKELPQKTEIIRYIELQDSQRDLYESIRVAMEEKVRKEIEKLGLAKSHIVILDALLKLRQVCCDPRLLKLDNPIKKAAASAKMDLLKEMLPELIEEGRRILIFSSFREMLVVIEELLQTLTIPYTLLTGQTLDRAKAIECFTSGEVPVFLISLKAGGVGLNLTSADTVIHVDPWWNPAAENQATDRAYRIGQDKPVFVYKLVSKDTVEEKIIAMQAKKQALADSIYSNQAMADAKITEQDLKMLFAPL